MQTYLINFLQDIKNLLPDLFAALVILLVSAYAAKAIGAVLLRALETRNASAGVSHLLSKTLKWVIISFGIIAALQRFFDITAFLAGLGIIGFTVGFALQNIMQNFVSGIILLVQQPFRIGDTVQISGYDGVALKIDLRTSELKTFDGLIVFLPNADILSKPIINYTRALRRRVELPVGVAYDSDPERVREICLEAVRSTPGFVSEPAPQILFQTFGASSIDLIIYFWVDTAAANVSVARNEALTRIKHAFEKHGIEIPYPIQTVRLPEKPVRKSASKKLTRK